VHGFNHLKLKFDEPVSNIAFIFNLRRYNMEGLRVMAREGACPTGTLSDRDSGATGSVVMTVDPPGPAASVAAAAAVR